MLYQSFFPAVLVSVDIYSGPGSVGAVWLPVKQVRYYQIKTTLADNDSGNCMQCK